jgi:hypothetical protein
MSDAKCQVPLQTSAEFVPTEAHEMIDAITAAVASAQAGLNWLRREPPDLEEVRQALNYITSAGKRAAEIAARL